MCQLKKGGRGSYIGGGIESGGKRVLLACKLESERHIIERKVVFGVNRTFQNRRKDSCVYTPSCVSLLHLDMFSFQLHYADKRPTPPI